MDAGSQAAQHVPPCLVCGSELARAARANGLPDAEVCLVHVIETIRDVPFEELRDFYEPLERRAQSELERLAGVIGQAGAEVEVVVRYGNRVREIIDAARELAADLVLLGSHRIEHYGSSAGGLATISYQVAALAPCSVLLLKPSSAGDVSEGAES